jgi:hypothetical protein
MGVSRRSKKIAANFQQPLHKMPHAGQERQVPVEKII